LNEVIASLDKSELQICLVLDEDRRLLGTITDGDVRRALLRRQDMEATATSIMFTSPTVVSKNIAHRKVLELMHANNLRQLPVVNDQTQIIGLHFWNDINAPTQRENTIVIMAGGFGKRMQPLTENCPKPMLEVYGKPILEHIVERAVADGFNNFIISLFYMSEVITNYFGDGSKWNCNISYVHEASPLGTAGALSLLNPRPDKPFVVTNGDVLTSINFIEMLEFHQANRATATMAVRQHELRNPFGVVHTEGIKIIGFEEKPIQRSHVNAGVYVLNVEALDLLQKDEICDMPTLFERLNATKRSTIAYPTYETWLDIGRPRDLIEANKIMLDNPT
jgi:dTDP-glucose pyrophosphorylase/predicted transcriptional regulator